jgi:hypothetical protein
MNLLAHPRRGRLNRRLCLAITGVLGASGLACLIVANPPANADSTLGGYTVTSLAEAVTAQYEQPNLPIPATPSLEIDEGYASTSDNYGPSGNAVASTLYPGQVVANIGPSIGVIVPNVPLPPAPVWPLQAVSFYPQNPNSASNDEPGVNMDATSGASGNTATATLGTDAAAAGSSAPSGSVPASGSGNPLAASSILVGVAGMSSTSTSSTTNTSAIASATATDTGISILGGFIQIGAVTSTATAHSDGNVGGVSGSTAVAAATIAGEPVAITANGIQAPGRSPALALPISAIDSLLSQLGIVVAVSAPNDSIRGVSASRNVIGLSISINLKALDAAVNKVASLLPPTLLSRLPLPLPNQQTLTVAFAEVTASSAAAPNYVNVAANDTTGSGVDSGNVGLPLSAALPPTAPIFIGGSGSSTSGSAELPTSNTPAAPAESTGNRSPVIGTSELVNFRSDLGAGLLTLFVFAALSTAYAYKRLDDISETWGAECDTGPAQ